MAAPMATSVAQCLLFAIRSAPVAVAIAYPPT